MDHPPPKLVIFDDIFPHPLSAFRRAEFTAYLEEFPFAEVHSSATAFPLIHETRTLGQMIAEFGGLYPAFAKRVFPYLPERAFPAKLIYCVFLNNIATIVEEIERTRGAFVFTLYPGGGFRLNVAECDTRLERILRSPSFRKVIATQKITQDYLLEKAWCAADQVDFIYGGVFPPVHFTGAPVARKVYGRDKATIDIGFVAYKYMPGGRDKGFDVFIECANQLARVGNHLRFHVVGPFSKADAAAGTDQILFHGTLLTEELRRLYSMVDMIVSPNVPFLLAEGAFDGFPTGCCVEAALCGVAVFSTDLLRQNQHFVDGEEIVIVSRQPRELCGVLEHYIREYDETRRVGLRGQKVFGRVFGRQAQIAPRLEILSRQYSLARAS